MLSNIGATEMLIIFSLIIVFFGAKKLPDLAKGLGKGIRQFRNEVQDITKDVKGPIDDLKSHLK